MPVVCNNRVSKLNKIMLLKQRKKYNLPFLFLDFIILHQDSVSPVESSSRSMKRWRHDFTHSSLNIFFLMKSLNELCFFLFVLLIHRVLRQSQLSPDIYLKINIFCSLWLILKQKSLVNLTIFTFIDLFIMRFYCFIPMSLSCFSYGYNTSKPWY